MSEATVEGTENNESAAEQEELQDDNESEWSAFYDDEGRMYYCNEKTGESSWDAPEKFNPAPPQDEGEPVSSDKAEEASSEAMPQETTGGQQSAWLAYEDDEGREYFFNTVTEETTWEKPADLTLDGSAEETAQASTPIMESPTVNDEEPTSPTSSDEQPVESSAEADTFEEDKKEEEEEEEIVEESIDPAIQRLQDAEMALNQPDAIMEPGVMSHVTEVVSSNDGNPERAIQALSKSYFGTTAACGLLGRWLADLKSQSEAPDEVDPEKLQVKQSKVFRSTANDMRKMAQDVINRISRERFTNQGGDDILNLSKNEVAFLEEMMDSPRWRALLIDLSATNKDSAMLRYCLKSISKRGHHREIARRIDQSDHFAVFDAMLASELAVVGKIAVSACHEKDTAISLDELVGDLRRTCTSTAYTYIYALEVLRHLISTAKDKLSSTKENESQCFLRAVRKWERLSEDLQSSMIDPTSTNSAPLFRKRRLDVSVTISELHQRQRRRLMPSRRQGSNDSTTDNDQIATTETSVLSFLRRYSLGTRIDDRILDAMLPNGSSALSGILVGELLMRRPLTVQALLGYLYKPGTHRVGSIVTKNKCARLVALSALAAEKEICAEINEAGGAASPETDEVALTRKLIEGSDLCQQLESMVSFIVTHDGGKSKAGSPGEELVAMAMQNPLVAQGVAIWAREVIKGTEFVSSGTYPTVAPSILSLVRVLYTKHHSIRDDTLEVAFGFLSHSKSDSDVSYQKLSEIKEQSLRLLFFLSVRGEGPTVLNRITKLLAQPGSSPLDFTLVRYFASGLLEVANGPFSIPFLRSLAAFLKAPASVEALRTSYFEDNNKKRLATLMDEFKKLAENEESLLTAEDVRLLRSLLATYSVGASKN